LTEPDRVHRIILVSELFPPAIGGSAELLANIYSRVDQPVHVVAGGPQTVDRAPSGWASIERLQFEPTLGLVGIRALRQHGRLVRAVRRHTTRGSVVHCGRALPEGTAAMTAARMSAGCPFVVWTHGEELPIAARSTELRWLLRQVHRRSAALLSNSNNTARLLVDLGNPASKIHVIHPGVDAERFRPHADRDRLRATLLGREALMLLSVGRLQPRKGHDLVLRSLALLRGEFALRYVIAGDGPDALRLRTLARETGVDDLVTFLGSVPSSELPAYYAAADVFVHPNRVERHDFEGFGMVFLEAAASGVPAIGGRSGGVSEAIEDGVTGMLVGGEDPNELARDLRDLLLSRDRRATMGHAARSRVLARFTWKAAAARLQAVHDAVARAASRC
jgi:phosphatidylinositol alpha-1,6-mannosyltransferase